MNINDLFYKAAELYKKLTDIEANHQTNLGVIIADQYREQLAALTSEDMANICDNRKYASILNRNRENSVFYRDCVILLLYCLIDKNPNEVPKKWPFEQEYLRVIYSNAGVNPQAFGID